MGGMSWIHWVLVIVLVMLLFGRGKISDLMGDVAKGIKSFKKGMAEDEPPPMKTVSGSTTPSEKSPTEEPAKH